MSYRKKLIEVALPLEAINLESAREKSIRHGHPSTLHLWWSRKPLAACRAVLFASLVDDPSEYCNNEDSARVERDRLFKIIEDLVLWENINNEDVLDKARLEIARSVARDLGVDVPIGKQAIREFLTTKAPPVLDPFAGGGSLPLEAQRLGLRVYASDLNPVAVLINKTLIEFPPKFSGMAPVRSPEELMKSVNKDKRGNQTEFWKKDWKGAEGLAEDVRYYGQWMCDEAYKRIGHLYPPVEITGDMLINRPDLKSLGLKPGDKLTVIAWLWARSVKCPNPACGTQMPLVSKYWLRSKGKEQFWVEPVIKQSSICFNVRSGTVISNIQSINSGTCFTNEKGKKVKATFLCPVCKTGVAKGVYIDAEANSQKLGAIPLAVVAEWKGSRVYLNFHPFEDDEIKSIVETLNIPDEPARGTFASNAQGRTYGFKSFSDYFLPRQLIALATFSTLLDTVRLKIVYDASSRHELSELQRNDYSHAITTYLALMLDKGVNLWSSLSSWMGDRGAMRETFSQQGIAMSWDYAEANPFSDSGGGFGLFLEKATSAIQTTPAMSTGLANQGDATRSMAVSKAIIATDPPYYGNISYADIMDFFYVWLKRSLGRIYPDLFQTILIPKSTELVATPIHFDGSASKAKEFFESGLFQAFSNIFKTQTPEYPAIVFYAYKQSETEEIEDDDNEETSLSTASTGWETMLEGLIKAGFTISGTWPIRTESSGRAVAIGNNALASSIVIVSRPRHTSASTIARRDFLAFIKREIPPALRQLQQGSIAPVDLAQAAIGPGMAVFSRYKQVLEADGSPMRVRSALALINQALDEFLTEQEGEYDGDTRWALAWYEQYSHEQGPYGVAETLSKAKNTSVEGLVEAGILEARAGKVRMLRRDELDPNWDPQKDKRPTAWEACQHLIYDLDKNGEQTAAGLLAKLGGLSETARDLAYRLYTICERKGWAQDALGYNMLVVAWPRLRELARNKQEPTQSRLI